MAEFIENPNVPSGTVAFILSTSGAEFVEEEKPDVPPNSLAEIIQKVTEAELAGPTPASVAEGDMKPWMAARDIRVLAKRMAREITSDAEVAQSRKGWIQETDGALADLELTLGSQAKVHQRRSALNKVRLMLQRERTLTTTHVAQHDRLGVLKRDAETVHRLVQHLPTQPDIPVGDDANTIRAVKAILKGASADEAKLSAIANILSL